MPRKGGDACALRTLESAQCRLSSVSGRIPPEAQARCVVELHPPPLTGFIRSAVFAHPNPITGVTLPLQTQDVGFSAEDQGTAGDCGCQRRFAYPLTSVMGTIVRAELRPGSAVKIPASLRPSNLVGRRIAGVSAFDLMCGAYSQDSRRAANTALQGARRANLDCGSHPPSLRIHTAISARGLRCVPSPFPPP